MGDPGESDLRAQLARLRSLVDIADVMLVSLSHDGTIADLNRAACEVLAGTREELLGLDWFTRCLPEEVRGPVRALFFDALAGRLELPEHYVNEVLTLDGRRRTIAWRNRFAREGLAPGIVSISSGTDITDKLAAERALRESERRYRDIVQTSDEGIWVIDVEGRTTFANERMAGMLGCSLDELMRKSMYDFMDDELRATAASNLQRRREGVSEQHGFTFRRADGELLYTWITTNPMYDDEGRVTGALGMVTDVTDRVRAEAEQERLRAKMESLQRLDSLGVLAGGVAHDFNNLLAGILGNADLARRGGQLDDFTLERLDAVVEAAERATRLTRQLLLYAGHGEPHVEVLDLRSQVEALTDLVRATIPRSVRVRVEHDDPLPVWVEADHDRLQQLVMNLVANAAESYDGGQGEVLVRVRSAAPQPLADAAALVGAALVGDGIATLEVEDRGCGMDEVTRERMLDPFFSTKGAGRGLGMSTSLGFVRSHGGCLLVSTAPGRGTRVRVQLPSTQPPAEPAPQPAPSAPRPARVLVVDDEPLVRDLASNVLSRHGHRVEVAASGREALSRLAAGARFDVLMLDLSMPGLDGEATLRSARETGHDLPTIVCSGYLEHDVLRRFERLHPVSFLQKPFRPDDLLAAVAAACGRRPLRPRGDA